MLHYFPMDIIHMGNDGIGGGFILPEPVGPVQSNRLRPVDIAPVGTEPLVQLFKEIRFPSSQFETWGFIPFFQTHQGFCEILPIGVNGFGKGVMEFF